MERVQNYICRLKTTKTKNKKCYQFAFSDILQHNINLLSKVALAAIYVYVFI